MYEGKFLCFQLFNKSTSNCVVHTLHAFIYTGDYKLTTLLPGTEYNTSETDNKAIHSKKATKQRSQINFIISPNAGTNRIISIKTLSIKLQQETI